MALEIYNRLLLDFSEYQWCRDNCLDLHSGGTLFQTRLSCRLLLETGKMIGSQILPHSLYRYTEMGNACLLCNPYAFTILCLPISFAEYKLCR